MTPLCYVRCGYRRLLASALRAFPGSSAEEWGRLSGEARRKGLPPPVLDAMIAATARVHDLAVVTRNTNDFARLAVKLENPWTA